MPDGQVLEFTRVTKRFGAVDAVSDFSARIEPGLVTGFLGPNGAGKTTTLRMLLGLIRPTSGTATIGGLRYADLKHPLQSVGAALEASSFHPGRTGANHLKVYARAAGIPLSRVDEVLGLVDLSDAADRKVGGYSLGMRQRLGLATAMLGDPGVIVLDEPANGLDPEGIRWMRSFLRQLAREGRTVLTSSHLLTEVQQTAQALVIISRGRLVFQGGMHELAPEDEHAVVVDSPDRAALVQALREANVPFEVLRVGLTVRAADTAAIGAVAAAAGVALSSLQKRGPGLEEVFFELVNGLRLHPSASGISGTLEAGGQAQPETPTPSPAPAPAPAPADTTATSALPIIAPVPDAQADAAAHVAQDTAGVVSNEPAGDEPATADVVSAEPASADAEPASADAEPIVWPATAESNGTDEAPTPAADSDGAEGDAALADDSHADEPDSITSPTEDEDAPQDASIDAEERIEEPQPERPLPGMSGLAAIAASMNSGAPIDDDTPSPFGSLFGASSWASRIDTDSAPSTGALSAEVAPFTADEDASEPESDGTDAPADNADEAPVAFQVATTGVIDIIPAFDESDQHDSDEQDAGRDEESDRDAESGEPTEYEDAHDSDASDDLSDADATDESAESESETASESESDDSPDSSESDNDESHDSDTSSTEEGEQR